MPPEQQTTDTQPVQKQAMWLNVPIAAWSAGALLIGVLALSYVYFTNTRGVQETPKGPFTVVVVRNPPSLDIVWSNAHEYLQEIGYTDSIMRYVVVKVADNLASTKELLRPLVESEPDIIYTMGILATRAAKEVTEEMGSNVPVVFAVVSDPVGGGLVESFQSSGNNLTGVTPTNELVASKRLEFTKDMLPGTKRIIYAWNDERTSGVKRLRETALSLGLVLIDEHVESVEEMVAYIDSFPYEGGDVILRASDAIGGGSVGFLVQRALEKRIPLIGTHSGDTDRGALMSYGAEYKAIARKSVLMMDMILKGAHPSSIPIEEADSFELAVNTDTATQIGVTVPQSFLINAKYLFPVR